MSVLFAVVVGLMMGVVFGVALEKSRVFEPAVIVGQMQLKNFLMLKVFLTAVATGAIVLAALNGFGFVKLQPKAALYAADIVGGLVLGVGIALAGACPGTVLTQIGAGYRDALFTLLGGLSGAVAYSYAEPAFKGTMLTAGGGKIILSDLMTVPYWLAALVLAGLLIAALVALEWWRPWRQEIGRDVDGDIGSSTGTTARGRLAPAE